MKCKVDLHNHFVTFQYKGNFNFVVDRASKKLGPKGILGVKNYADHRYTQEVLTKQGHLLVFGLESKSNLKDKRSLEGLLKEVGSMLYRMINPIR